MSNQSSKFAPVTAADLGRVVHRIPSSQTAVSYTGTLVQTCDSGVAWIEDIKGEQIECPISEVYTRK